MTTEFPPHARAISAEEWGPGYELWRAVSDWLGQRGPEGTNSVVRVASHLVIVIVAVAVLGLSRIQLPNWEIRESTGAAQGPSEPVLLAAVPPPAGKPATGSGFVRAPLPVTLIPERPHNGFQQHTVQAGDTLYAIADQYHITADTLVWANDLEDNPDLLRLGQQLTILPVDGVLHQVVAGDTLEGIAKKYKAKVADIIGFEGNQLDPQNPVITPGQKIVVPAGVKPEPPAKPKPAAPVYGLQTSGAPANAPRGGGRLIWPISGYISQGYGRYHLAIDIASYIGVPIKAADAGYVAVAGWSNVGYGYHVIVDHGNGMLTLYAHLSRIDVKAGQAVGRGQVIGAVGSTGNSTGPHLHFEVRIGGVGQNPFNYLP